MVSGRTVEMRISPASPLLGAAFSSSNLYERVTIFTLRVSRSISSSESVVWAATSQFTMRSPR